MMKRKLILTTAIVGVAFALPSGTSAAPFAYVTNKGADSVSQYDIGAGGLLAPLSPFTVPASKGPSDVVVSPDGRNVYVANNGYLVGDPDDVPASVSQYDVGANGTLLPKSPASVISCGAMVTQLAVSPDGKSLYVPTMADCSVIDQYDIGADGTLAPKSPAAVEPDPDSQPIAVAVSPDSRSVYVTDFRSVRSGGGLILQYDADAGGALSPKSPPAVAVLGEPGRIAVSADGKSVYVTDQGPNFEDGSVLQYNVGSGGKLSSKSPARVAAGTDPHAIAVNPDGKGVYVGSFSGGNATILQYDVGTGGALSPKSSARVAGAASDIAVSPDGGSVYAARFGGVDQYDVGASGRLSPKSPASVTDRLGTSGVAVSPVPTTKDQCRRGGWKRFGFKNQGRCIGSLKHGPK
jgi:DNA-binding beta-propeller fold protein YncE